MKYISKEKLIELLLIVFLGLTPLLWFKVDQLILGHDAGLTLNPIPHFYDRLFLWTERFGFGHDQSYALPGVFIHGLEAGVMYLVNDLQLTQKLVFIFWFLLPGLTMFYFATKMEKRLSIRYFALTATVLYMFNHFILQGWFIAERTKFSIYAALPLFLAFLFDWEDKKRNTLQTAILISLTFFILNGEASLPLFGAVLITSLVFIIYYFLYHTKKEILSGIQLLGITGIISFFLHGYWLFPFIHYVRTSYDTVVQQAGGLGGIIGWITYISEHTSLINLFRLQGIPEWYENTAHPYAGTFLANPLFIIISFFIPLLAYGSLFILQKKPQRKYILFFILLSLVSILFSAGSHPPFGAFYIFLIRFVPGFLAFRTPFYKFAPGLWFAYAFLIAFTVGFLIKKYIEPKNKFFAYGFYLLTSVGIILYSHPFLTGSFFDYIVGSRTTRVVVPKYIYEFRDWSSTPERLNKRTLMLPPTGQHVESYTWGYWSLSPITSLTTNASIVNQYGLNVSDTELMNSFYLLMKHNDSNWIQVARMLGIESFVVRNDFAWSTKDAKTDNPVVYENVLRTTPDVNLVKTFGKWKIYDIAASPKQDTYRLSDINYIEGNPSYIPIIATSPTYNPFSITYRSGDFAENQEELLSNANNIYIGASCIMCSLQTPLIDEGLFTPTFTADSFLYPYLQSKHKEKEKLLITTQQRVEYFINKSFTAQKGLERVIDEKKSTDAIEIQMDVYHEILRELHSNITKLTQEKSIANNTILLQSYQYLSRQRNNYINKISQVSDRINIKKFNTVFTLLDDTVNLLDKNIWYTKDLVEKRYTFNVPQKMTYELLLKGNTISDSTSISSRTFTFAIDDNQFQAKPSDIGNGWFSLGSTTFEQGIHKMNFSDNVLLNQYVSPNASYQVTYTPGQKQSCFTSPLISAETDDIFSIAIDYKQVKGDAIFFFYPLQRNDLAPLFTKQGENFKKPITTQTFNADYIALNNDGFYFKVCARASADRDRNPSILEIQNIKIYKIVAPVIVFHAKRSEPNVALVDINKLKKIDQVTYTIDSKSDLRDTVILHNEAFNHNWNFEGATTQKFKANGFANAWVIKEAKTKPVIRYNAQRLVIIGTITTLITLCIMTLLYSLSIKRKR